MKLNEKLYEYRKNKNWSQEELAERLEVSRQTVSKWESGRAIPELNKLIRISEIYNVTVDELVKDEVEMNETNVKKVNKFNKKIVKNVVIILLVISLVILILFILNIQRRKNIINEIAEKYKESFQSIGETKSGLVVENITQVDLNNTEEFRKEYLYYVSEDGKKLLKITSYDDEYYQNKVEEVYIDLNKEIGMDHYADVTKINLKTFEKEVIKDYEFISPIKKVTQSMNDYYSFICEYELYSEKELAYDFNNKFLKTSTDEKTIYNWMNNDIGNFDLGNNIWLIIDGNEFLGLNFDKYEDDIKDTRQHLNIQITAKVSPIEDEVTIPDF